MLLVGNAERFYSSDFTLPQVASCKLQEAALSYRPGGTSAHRDMYKGRWDHHVLFREGMGAGKTVAKKGDLGSVSRISTQTRAVSKARFI